MGRSRASILFALLLLGGCTAPGALPATGTVRVLGSWNGAELEGFRAVLAPFEQRTGIEVTYEVTRDLRGVLTDRMASGDPPDISGLEGPAHLRDLASANALRDLGQVLDMGAYRAVVAPTFVDLGSVEGRLLGVFVRSSMKGLIWYSPRTYRLSPPRTWDELGRLALQATELADATWCIGLASEESSGWPGTDLIEQFVLRSAGVDRYDAWVTGELSWTSTEVRRAFELYGQVVAAQSVHGGVEGALTTDFRRAGDGLFLDPPGCLFFPQGSFMAAYFEAAGRRVGEDVEMFPFPALGEDDRGAIIGAGDLLGLLSDSPAAAELMRYLVSDEGQTVWVSQGGSLSVNPGLTGYPDTVSRRAAQLLSGADVFRFDASDQMPARIARAFWGAVLEITAEPRRLDEILASLEVERTGGSRGEPLVVD
jgi:alpha-glucoside transport system substrate-binding protein